MSAAVAGLVALVGAVAVRAVARLGDRRSWPTVGLLRAPPVVRAALDDAGVAVPADRVWSVAVVAVLGGVGLGAAAGGPGLAAVVLVAGAGGPALVLAAARGRSARRVDAALPDALDGVARSLRSGSTLHQALAEVAPGGRLGDDLAAVVFEAEGGLPLVAALERWATRCPTPGVRLAAAALALATESGGAAARAVDGVAATSRANLAVAAEVRAQASQARLSAAVIALAPLAFATLAAATDARTAGFLLRTPFGLACLGVGLALDGVAAWWMQRITAVAG